MVSLTGWLAHAAPAAAQIRIAIVNVFFIVSLIVSSIPGTPGV